MLPSLDVTTSKIVCLEPEIEVETNQRGLPAIILWGVVRHQIEPHHLWRLMPRSWNGLRGDMDHYLVDSETLHCVVFRDMVCDTWHMARVY